MRPAGGPLRGQVFEAEIPEVGRKLWLVVSNNARNSAFHDVLVVRMTTTAPKAPRAAVVALDKQRDGFGGWVVCDDLGPLPRALLGSARGALSPGTMRLVDNGLRAALGI